MPRFSGARKVDMSLRDEAVDSEGQASLHDKGGMKELLVYQA